MVRESGAQRTRRPHPFGKKSVFITEVFPVCFHLSRFEGLQIPIQAQVRQPR